MKPLKKRKRNPLERDLVNDVIRPHLKSLGYAIVQKTHGNRYQKGLPDLYCFMPARALAGLPTETPARHRWFEAKRPGGTLTPKQKLLFQKWSDVGLEVEVVTVVDGEVQFSNWRKWA